MIWIRVPCIWISDIDIMCYSSLIFFYLFNDFLEACLCVVDLFVCTGAVLCKGFVFCFILLFKVSEIQWGQRCSLSEYYYETEIVMCFGVFSISWALLTAAKTVICTEMQILGNRKNCSFSYLIVVKSGRNHTIKKSLKKEKRPKKKTYSTYVMKGFWIFAWRFWINTVGGGRWYSLFSDWYNRNVLKVLTSGS